MLLDGQCLGGQEPDALEDPVAARAVVLDQRLGDERRDVGRAGAGHRRRRLERESAGERRERAKGPYQFGRQPLEAPSDRSVERLVAQHVGATTRHQQRKPLVEVGSQVDHIERGRGRGRQFERERHTVQAAAHLLDRGPVGVVDREAGHRRLGARCEQLHRSREREHTDGDDGLAVDAQRLLAGGEEPRVGCAARDGIE